MSAAVTVEILLGLLTVIAGFGSFQLATRAAKASERAATIGVDAAAYIRAKELYESTISQLRIELARQVKSSQRLEDEVGRLNQRSLALTDEVVKLRRSNETLQDQLSRFKP